LEYKGQVVFEKLSLPSFDRMPKTYVEEEACFIFVNQGEFAVRSQAEYLHLKKGTGLLAKCLNYFFEQDSQQREKKAGVEVIAVVLYPSMIKELFQFDVMKSSHTVDFDLKRVVVDEMLQAYQKSIEILLENPEMADDALLKLKLKEFILLISKTQQAPSQLDFLAAMFKPNFASFKSTIHNNLYASLSLDELAALCHLSTSSFRRKFQAVFGESPRKYLTRKKIERAQELLEAKGLRITEAAFESGFESLATFNRTFKNQVGISPSAYRLNKTE
jgi:AraC-like DNA-binding protein